MREACRLLLRMEGHTVSLSCRIRYATPKTPILASRVKLLGNLTSPASPFQSNALNPKQQKPPIAFRVDCLISRSLLSSGPILPVLSLPLPELIVLTPDRATEDFPLSKGRVLARAWRPTREA